MAAQIPHLDRPVQAPQLLGYIDTVDTSAPPISPVLALKFPLVRFQNFKEPPSTVARPLASVPTDYRITLWPCRTAPLRTPAETGFTRRSIVPMAIHPSAVIDPKAELDSSVEVGPFVTIEGPVCIGAGTRVRPQAYISGWTQIGQRCDIHPQAVVGHLPQDFHYQGERTYCRIGDEVVIREGSTVHRGTQPESATVIGDGCVLLAYSHVAHNCQLGRRVKIYNMSLLSGHAEIDDDAIVSGYSLVHQFCRVGRLAYVAGASIINKDLPV